MLDIKWIRDNPAALDEALQKRSAEPQAQAILALDETRRSAIQKLQDMQSRRNAASKEIGAAMTQKNTELAEQLKQVFDDARAAGDGGADWAAGMYAAAERYSKGE